MKFVANILVGGEYNREVRSPPFLPSKSGRDRRIHRVQRDVGLRDFVDVGGGPNVGQRRRLSSARRS